MDDRRGERDAISRLVRWGQERDDVRAMLLTGSRSDPSASVDEFSDFDIVLVVNDVHAYLAEESWLAEFGPVLALYRDPVRLEQGCERFCRVTQYEDGTKIDFTVWPVDIVPRISQLPGLPDYLDMGYRVLLDKDQLTAGLKAATHKAYVPAKPSQHDYLILVEHFLSNAPYVAKHLCRGDLVPMKYVMDHVMKLEYLRTMLEWLMEIDHGWTVKPGAYGKGLAQYVGRETWARLERTYVGAGIAENWGALFETISLFRTVATEVAERLGYTYPLDLDDRVTRYVKAVHENAGQHSGGR